jgi:hypothetical protein
MKEGTRELVLSRVPYLMVYRISGDVIDRSHIARRTAVDDCLLPRPSKVNRTAAAT